MPPWLVAAALVSGLGLYTLALVVFVLLAGGRPMRKSPPLVLPGTTYHPAGGGRYAVDRVERGVVHGRVRRDRRWAAFDTPVDDFLEVIADARGAGDVGEMFGNDTGGES